MVSHKDFCDLEKGSSQEGPGELLAKGNPQKLNGILLSSCEIVASLNTPLFLYPLTSQQAPGALLLLPGSDDSDYFYQHLSPPPPPFSSHSHQSQQTHTAVLILDSFHFYLEING